MSLVRIMNTYRRLGWRSAVLAGCLAPATLAAAEDVAVVTAETLNVRGQPTIFSEVVTQLKRDDPVIILEEIKLTDPVEGDPVRWARIQLPENTPVWVFAPLIDAVDQSVKVNLLNLRSGPGENFSVLGRIEKGTKVTAIRTVDTWTEIEAPAGAYAFAASEYLKKAPASAPVPATPPKEPKPPTKEEPASLEQANSEPPPPVTEEPPVTAEPVDPQPAEGQAANSGSESEPVSDPVTPPAAKPNVASAEPPPVGPAEVRPSEVSPRADSSGGRSQPRRIVWREGIVRSTLSIQAPTYFELISAETRKTINYLHSSSPGINFKDYRGRRIVVTGEEGIDRRWPNTPVIEVETLEIAP